MIGQKILFKNKGGTLKQKLNLMVIPNSEANQICKKYHYLHRARTGGQQISLGIFYEGELLGIFVFASPTFIKKKGLIPPLRQGEVIELARMWLSDKIPKFGETCSLGKALKEIGKIWYSKYSIQPRAIVSFADLEAGHEGKIYKAANFEDWGFAKYARKADAGKTYSRNEEKWGKRWSRGDKIAPRTSNTKRTYIYYLK